MKEHKTQILAALALAFTLGAMLPSAVFASDGAEAGIEAQAEGTGAGANEGEVISEVVSENIAELYNRIQKNDSFSGYRTSITLINAVNAMSVYLDSAEAVLSDIDGATDKTLWESLSATTQEALADKTAEQSIIYLKASDDYTIYKTQIDKLNSDIKAAKSALVDQVKKFFVTATGVDTMTSAQLIETAKTLPKYDAYVKLYESTKFARALVSGDAELTAAAVEQALPNPGMQTLGYNEMALAAVAIDPEVMQGLMPYTLPETGAGVETPDSGIVGIFEAGALDLATLTLIVSVALASAAGLALIAKLYLKHKF